MQGISDRALKSNYAKNKYGFNVKELQNQEFAGDGSKKQFFENYKLYGYYGGLY